MKLSWLPLPSPVWRVRPAKRGGDLRSLSLLSGATCGAMVFVPVPRPLKELLSSLAGAPESGAPSDEKLAWLDEIAARLVGGVAAFCDEPQALVPAQRSLLLMANRRSTVKGDLADLSRALRKIDEQVGASGGGFSRLLDAALSAGEVAVEERLDAASVDEELRPLALALQQVARELLALDDLAHALSVSADLAAGALVLEGALDLAEGEGVVAEAESAAVAMQVVARRSLDGRLATLVGMRAGLTQLDESLVAEAVRAKVAVPLALWVLAHRLARHERLEEALDRPALDKLLASAGLVPLEVFDAASLWRDLDDEHA